MEKGTMLVTQKSMVGGRHGNTDAAAQVCSKHTENIP